MKKLLVTTMIAGSLATGAAALGTGTAGAAPMEWARFGPYASTWTCEQARDNHPVTSRPCFYGSDGRAYYYGLRQARR